MAAIIKENNEKSLFQLKDSFEDKNVYQRIVKQQGRTKNEVKEIINQLPTATVHFFTEEEFNRLKEIEKELNSQITKIQEKKSFSNSFLKFMEI